MCVCVFVCWVKYNISSGSCALMWMSEHISTSHRTGAQLRGSSQRAWRTHIVCFKHVCFFTSMQGVRIYIRGYAHVRANTFERAFKGLFWGFFCMWVFAWGDVIEGEADTSLSLCSSRVWDKVRTLSVKTHQQTHAAQILRAGDTRQGRRDKNE